MKRPRTRAVKLRLMNTNKLTIGLDLGDRKHTYCVLSVSGKILAAAALAKTCEALSAFSAGYGCQGETV